MVIRSWMIAMKYATYTQRMYEDVHERNWTFGEILSELMVLGWIAPTPDKLLSEVAQCLKR
jgi:hypothetical protein